MYQIYFDNRPIGQPMKEEDARAWWVILRPRSTGIDMASPEAGGKESTTKTIKISNHALNLIPKELVIFFDSSWEDGNLSGLEQARIDCQKIGTGVMLQTGDYIIPPCTQAAMDKGDYETHYHCSLYDAWYVVAWVSDKTWAEYGDRIMMADREWREQINTCRVEPVAS